jgi:FtsP/CotA-like multicopper oxidase with cupredoxin domain
MNRRHFLSAAAGAAALAVLPRAPAQPRPDISRLTIATAEQALAGVGNPRTAVWAYNGTVPGPELRFRQGDRLRIEVENRLDVDTTVHWHGIRLPNPMDGVPHLTQPPIAAGGGRFLYEFALPDAGTYWYHPHLGSPEQVGRGLYGALVVEEPSPPPVDRDLVWVLSDWRLDRQARNAADFRNFMDSSHAGRIGNTVTVNGAVRDTFAVRAGERIRLRLLNASNARIYGLRFEGHDPWIVALDGHPVEPYRGERVVLGPGMRADLIVDCAAAPGSAHRVIDDFYARRAYELLKLVYSDGQPLRSGVGPPSRVADNPVAEPDAANAERHRVVFGGGMMGAIPAQREHRGLFWTVNGAPVREDDHRHSPLLSLAHRRSHVIELVNDTAWHHPIHLHGHAFRIVSRNGKPHARRQWSDTVLLDPDGRAEIALVADNPGDWMLHCHVLEHQATGMMAVVRVG